jgi:hypothetical protein
MIKITNIIFINTGVLSKNNIAEVISKFEAERSISYLINWYSTFYQHYRLLNEYARDRGIEIVNLTKGGLLDVFPVKKYETVIRNT